jgi:arabinosaccharide transport system permease protein
MSSQSQGEYLGESPRQIITEKVAPYLFISPFFILFTIFMIYPIFYSLILSLHDVKGPQGGPFVGLRNYVEIFQTDRFRSALENTTAFAGGMLVLSVIFGFALALILDSPLIPGRKFFRLAYFLPILTSTVVAGAVFKLIYADSPGGLLNSAVAVFGVEPQRWIQGNFWALKSVVGLALWRSLGLNTMYFLAGLQGLPSDVYESATIDGANLLQKIWYLTIPLMRPVIGFVSVITLIHSYLVFTEVFMLSPGGGAKNNMVSLGYYMYESAFRFFKLGTGAAVGFVMTVVILVLSVVQLALVGAFRKED